MASNEITFTVKVKKDGNLKVIAKDADKAAKGTEKLRTATETTTKARNRFSKGEKGVASAGANSTKNFSKMQQTMMGSGGLVGAYATLAANVFALTAAFGILRRAAAATQLAEGLEYTGRAAGRALPYIADRLREITGAAVSTQEAMSAVAIATSAGFSSDQIAKLGMVAKGASLALGRDMTDALNRLIRGAAKLEPELLDELGIMVRLDDAAQTYAGQLGTTVESLSHFQKRQAFVNAIIKEGTTSFAGIAQAIDPNAYDQLASTLKDLLKTFVTWLNKGIIPVVKLFSKSPTALVGGVLLFASTIRGALLPGLTGGAKRMAEFAEQAEKTAKASLSQVTTTGKLPTIYGELTEKIEAGTATTKDFNDAQSSLNSSLTKHNSDLVHNSTLQDTNTQKYKDKIRTINNVKGAQAQLNKIQKLSAIAATEQARANTLASAANLNIKETITNISTAMGKYRIQLQTTAIAAGKASVSFESLKVALFATGLSLKSLGAALLTALPFLAMIPVVLGLGYEMYEKFFGDSELIKKQKEIFDNFEHLAEAGQQLAETLRMIELEARDTAGWDAFTAKLKVAAGFAGEFRDRIKEAIAAQDKARITGMADKEGEIFRKRQALAESEAADKEAWKNKRGPFSPPAQVSTTTMRHKKALAELEAEADVLQANWDMGEDLVTLIAGAEAQLRNQTATGAIDKSQQEHYRTLIDEMIALSKQSSFTRKDLEKLLDVQTKAEAQTSSLGTIEAAMAGINKEGGKLNEKVVTPFDKMNQYIQDLKSGISAIVKDGGTEDLTDAQIELNAALNDVHSPLSIFLKKYREGGEDAITTVTRLSGETERLTSAIASNAGEQKTLAANLKKLNIVRKESGSMAYEALEVEEALRLKKLEQINNQIELYTLLNLNTDQSKMLNKLDAEKTANIASQKTEATGHLEVVKGIIFQYRKWLHLSQEKLDNMKEALKIAEREQRLSISAANFANPDMRTGKLTAKQERSLQKELLKDRKDLILREAFIKWTTIQLEYALLKAQSGLLRERLVAANADTSSLDRYDKLLEASRKSSGASVIASALSLSGAAGDTTAQDEAVRDSAVAAFGKGETIGERFYEGFFGADAAFSELNMEEKFKAVHTAMAPLLKDLRSLGPQGEIVAGLTEGILITGANIVKLTEKIDYGGGAIKDAFGLMKSGVMSFSDFISSPEFVDVAVAALSTIGSAIGQLAGLMAAASKNRVAGVDAEIAAEKKRDGTSAKSLAKIKGLEKKKEMMQRKAFEQNKKMMIAQAIMSTAAGAIGVYAGVKDISTAFIAGIMSAAIVAMGMAQVAIISGMSYQGGGGTPSASGPTQISVGERGKSSDLSKSSSARGELAYFRGEQGMGGAENFRSAFYGRKHRAAGGNAGYVVGEQGPELFMPDRPGTIVPSDDVSAAGGATNVTFSINAIDAAGVEDVLVQQQGNIIGMLREAANSYGEDFMEDLDESTYTAPMARRA